MDEYLKYDGHGSERSKELSDRTQRLFKKIGELIKEELHFSKGELDTTFIPLEVAVNRMRSCHCALSTFAGTIESLIAKTVHADVEPEILAKLKEEREQYFQNGLEKREEDQRLHDFLIKGGIA